MNFQLGMIDDANSLVRRFHYSRRPPGNVQIVGTFHLDGGLLGDKGECVAAIYFSIPPTRWSEKVLELSRLVRSEKCDVPLSIIISRACKVLKQRNMIDLLVSFADSTQGHHGGIYQACSWNYDGKRDKRMDGCIVDGVFIPGRSCNSKFGTQSPDKLRGQLKCKVEPNYDEGKHLYWRALNKSGIEKANRLGLKSLPYPKPDNTSIREGEGAGDE